MDAFLLYLYFLLIKCNWCHIKAVDLLDYRVFSQYIQYSMSFATRNTDPHSQCTLFRVLNKRQDTQLTEQETGISIQAPPVRFKTCTKVTGRNKQEFYYLKKKLTFNVQFKWPESFAVGTYYTYAEEVLLRGTSITLQFPQPDDTAPLIQSSQQEGTDTEGTTTITDEWAWMALPPKESVTEDPEYKNKDPPMLRMLHLKAKHSTIRKLIDEYSYHKAHCTTDQDYHNTEKTDKTLSEALTHFVLRTAENIVPRKPLIDTSTWWCMRVFDSDEAALEFEVKMVSKHKSFHSRTRSIGPAREPEASLFTLESGVLTWGLDHELLGSVLEPEQMVVADG